MAGICTRLGNRDTPHNPRSAHARWGVQLGVVKSWFLTYFWQIRRIYAIVMMSEMVGIDIHEIEFDYTVRIVNNGRYYYGNITELE